MAGGRSHQVEVIPEREDALVALPGGHSEGYDDTHKQLHRRFYRKVADPSAPVEFPTFEDGLWGMKLLVKVLESVEKQGWVKTL